MKIPLTYGAFIAIGSSLLTLGLFFFGYHSDPAKLSSVQFLTLAVGIIINLAGIILGMRARRAQVPPTEAFTYGQALVTGLLIGLFAALFAALFNLLYSTVINPDFREVMFQQQTAKFEAAGMNSDQIEKASGMLHMMLRPAVQFVFALIIGALWGVVVSLIAAAFVKRPVGQGQEPPVPTV